MRMTISEARAHLGHLCTRAQDPRQIIMLTRHGKPIAALVSIPEVQRIWDLSEAQTHGARHPLTGKRGRSGLMGMVMGRNGDFVTTREAAQQVREIQMDRAAERAVLEFGGLEPVEGGEVTGPDLRDVSEGWPQRVWRRVWRFRGE